MVRDIPVVPIFHSDITPSELPVPLSMLQAIEGGKAKDIEKLYKRIAEKLHSKVPETDLEKVANAVSAFEEKNIAAKKSADDQISHGDGAVTNQSLNNGNEAETLPANPVLVNFVHYLKRVADRLANNTMGAYSMSAWSILRDLSQSEEYQELFRKHNSEQAVTLLLDALQEMFDSTQSIKSS